MGAQVFLTPSLIKPIDMKTKKLQVLTRRFLSSGLAGFSSGVARLATETKMVKLYSDHCCHIHTRRVGCLEGRFKATCTCSTCDCRRFLVPAVDPSNRFPGLLNVGLTNNGKLNAACCLLWFPVSISRSLGKVDHPVSRHHKCLKESWTSRTRWQDLGNTSKFFLLFPLSSLESESLLPELELPSLMEYR